MALTFTQHPIEAAIQTPVITNWTPIVPYMVNKSSISGLFYYKFIMEIRETDVSGTLLAKIKQRKSLAFLIQRSIYQKGLQRTQFFTRPFTTQLKKQENKILQAFADDLEVQLKQTFKD